jgi:hypothetical protein
MMRPISTASSAAGIRARVVDHLLRLVRGASVEELRDLLGLADGEPPQLRAASGLSLGPTWLRGGETVAHATEPGGVVIRRRKTAQGHKRRAHVRRGRRRQRRWPDGHQLRRVGHVRSGVRRDVQPRRSVSSPANFFSPQRLAASPRPLLAPPPRHGGETLNAREPIDRRSRRRARHGEGARLEGRRSGQPTPEASRSVTGSTPPRRCATRLP